MKKKSNNKKIDKGFELVYWKLSYRRKFIRTLWMAPFVVLAVFLVWAMLKSVLITSILAIVMLFGETVQAIYTYKKWKDSESGVMAGCE